MLRVNHRQVELIHPIFRQLNPFWRIYTGCFAWDDFASGSDQQLGQAAGGSLAGGVKGADGIDLIAEKLQACRVAGRGRPDIQDTAAVRELSRLQHSVRRLITQVDPGAFEHIWRDLLIHLQKPRRLEKLAPRQRAGHQGAHRTGNDRRMFRLGHARQVIVGQQSQRLQAVAPGKRTPGGLFIEEWVRFGKDLARRAARPERKLIQQGHGPVGPVGEQQHRAVQVGVQRRQHRQARGAQQGQPRSQHTGR